MKAKVLVLLANMLLVCGNLYAANGDLIVNGNFNLLPPGTVVMFGGATIPENSGWLIADGSSVSRTTYAALFAAICDTTQTPAVCPYGTGDGSTTFNLPDFRGIFPKGAGTTNRAAGKDASGNFYAGVLGTYSQDQLQGHTHAMKYDGSNYFSGAGFGALRNQGQYGTNAASQSGIVSDGTNSNPRVGHTTEPQSLGVHFIIKY